MPFYLSTRLEALQAALKRRRSSSSGPRSTKSSTQPSYSAGPLGGSCADQTLRAQRLIYFLPYRRPPAESETEPVAYTVAAQPVVFKCTTRGETGYTHSLSPRAGHLRPPNNTLNSVHAKRSRAQQTHTLGGSCADQTLL
eukprot:scaffold23688_cov51-Phaeocystis_antarctica.AAC.3